MIEKLALQPSPAQNPPAPDALESLEAEMARLLGLPAPDDQESVRKVSPSGMRNASPKGPAIDLQEFERRLRGLPTEK